MRCSGALPLLAYPLLLGALVFYGLSIWACPGVFDGSIVEMSTNTTEFAELKLGYVSTCVSYPLSGSANVSSNNNTNQSSQQHCTRSFDTIILTPSELADELIRHMNLTTTPSKQYTESLISLIEAAGALHAKELFGSYLPIAAFSLLVASGIFFINPLFFNPAHRRKVCDWLLLLAALSASFGLMAAAGSTFSLIQVQGALEVAGVLNLPSAPAGNVSVVPGRMVATWMRLGIGLAGSFTGVIGVLAFVRHGGHMRDCRPSKNTKHPAITGSGSNDSHSWIQAPWEARKQQMELLPVHGKQMQTTGRGSPWPKGRQTKGCRRCGK